MTERNYRTRFQPLLLLAKTGITEHGERGEWGCFVGVKNGALQQIDPRPGGRFNLFGSNSPPLAAIKFASHYNHMLHFIQMCSIWL